MQRHEWDELQTFLLSQRDLCPSTTQKTLRHLRVLEREGIDLVKPTRPAYDEWLAKRKMAGRTGPGLRHYPRALRHLLAFRGEAWPDFKLPRVSVRRRELLPEWVIKELLDYAEEDVDELAADTARFLFRIGFYQLVRPPSEMHDLELPDVDLNDARLRVWSDKTESYDTLDLTTWEVEHYRDYIMRTRRRVLERSNAPDVAALVLDPNTGRPFASRGALRMFMARHMRRIYFRAKPYDLRAAGATMWYVQTRDIEFVRARLRHVGLGNISSYVRAGDAILRRRGLLGTLRPFDVARDAGGEGASRSRRPRPRFQVVAGDVVRAVRVERVARATERQ